MFTLILTGISKFLFTFLSTFLFSSWQIDNWQLFYRGMIIIIIIVLSNFSNWTSPHRHSAASLECVRFCRGRYQHQIFQQYSTCLWQQAEGDRFRSHCSRLFSLFSCALLHFNYSFRRPHSQRSPLIFPTHHRTEDQDSYFRIRE